MLFFMPPRYVRINSILHSSRQPGNLLYFCHLSLIAWKERAISDLHDAAAPRCEDHFGGPLVRNSTINAILMYLSIYHVSPLE